MRSEEPLTELSVGVREPGLVGAHERIAVDVAGRVLTQELAVHLDDAVGREAAAAEQLLHLGARQSPASTQSVAHRRRSPGERQQLVSQLLQTIKSDRFCFLAQSKCHKHHSIIIYLMYV